MSNKTTSKLFLDQIRDLMSYKFCLPSTYAKWQQVGGVHESYLRTFQGVSATEQQTAKMAEGPEPPANCEFIITTVMT